MKLVDTVSNGNSFVLMPDISGFFHEMILTKLDTLQISLMPDISGFFHEII